MKIITVNEMPRIKEQAALWFSQKWQIPEYLYLKSISDSLKEPSGLTTWYLVMENDEIIAGAGVISNDLSNQNELPPTVCAVYVEPEYRGRGIAGSLIGYMCVDMAFRGAENLYLTTEMEGFYERLGWEFIMTIEDDGKDMRLYRHNLSLFERCLI